jgi:choline-glycine betaine transporter
MTQDNATADVDWLIFSLSAALLALVVLPVILFPDASLNFINQVFSLLTTELGVIYVALTTAIIALLLTIAIGPLGSYPPRQN